MANVVAPLDAEKTSRGALAPRIDGVGVWIGADGPCHVPHLAF